MKKILGLAISAAMAVSAVMPWTGVTAFAEETQEPALVMEQTGEPEEEPAAGVEMEEPASIEPQSAWDNTIDNYNDKIPMINFVANGEIVGTQELEWNDVKVDEIKDNLLVDDYATLTLNREVEFDIPEDYQLADNRQEFTTRAEVEIIFFIGKVTLMENPTFEVNVIPADSETLPVKTYILDPQLGYPEDGSDQGYQNYFPSAEYGNYNYEDGLSGVTLTEAGWKALKSENGELDIGDEVYGDDLSAYVEVNISESDTKAYQNAFGLDSTKTIVPYVIKVQNAQGDVFGYAGGEKADIHVDFYVTDVTVSIHYHANYKDATDTPKTFEATTGTEYSVLDYEETGLPAREGYTFDGWATESEGNVEYEADESFTVKSEMNLYAVWSQTGEPVVQYPVRYEWTFIGEAQQPEVTLPEGSVAASLDEAITNKDTIYTTDSKVEVEGGTWVFSGWTDPTDWNDNQEFVFTGTWTFEADEEPPVVEPSDDNVDLDKTATDLVDDTTDVTLSIGADEETTASDVVFVLDKSASLDIRNEAMNMLDELKGRVDEGHIINVGVVNFEKGVLQKLDLTPFTEENRTTIEKSVTYSNSESSGTNIHGALAAGKAMLDADDSVSDSNKHLVLVTDGVGYLWGADPAGNNVYSIYSESIANGEENLYASPETMAWHHTGSDYYNEFLDMENWYTENGSDIENDINTYGILFEEGQYQAKNYGITSGQGRDTDWSKIPKFIEENSYVPDESLLSTASASDAAMYMVAQVWNEIASEYNAYAYADPRYSKAHPWAYTAISNLGDLGGFSSVIPETKEEYSGMFDAVKSSVLYEIEEGTVTDVIGEDFDFAGMDTLTLTVSGVALERTSIEGTTAIFGDGYEVTYTNENGTETLVWEIKVPVEEGKGVALTYTLNLVNKSTTPGSYEVPTNEEAVLDYTSTTGAENQKEFPVPEVTYTVADTSEPSDPGPDNPPYIPDGGDEEEPSEPTEEIPEEETPQTSLPTDDTSVPDAIPGEPSAPSTEEIPDNTTPQTAQPPQTGARAAGSVVLLAGAAVVAALTLRRKK